MGSGNQRPNDFCSLSNYLDMKYIICFILLFSISLSCMNSPRTDRVSYSVSDFTKMRVDTLKPIPDEMYVAYYIKVSGQVNDTVKFHSPGLYDIVLSGEIDTLINSDYYGTHDMIWIFNPYKATSGKLEIEISL